MAPFYLLLAALLLDRVLGEPRRWHPLIGFGRIVQGLETLCLGSHGHETLSAAALRLRGVFAVLALICVLVWPLLLLLHAVPTWANIIGQVLLLYFCIGWTSLKEHGLAVAQSLNQQDLNQARARVAMIVSRDADRLDQTGVATAATESVLENGNDAVFGAVFWFCIGGAPAAVTYRLINTLDAMWGYRTARYRHFGWFAARLDDVVNYPAARLCATGYSLVGRTHTALRCWRKQAGACGSPNGGPVMAAGAGALGIQLGGPAFYHGALQEKPLLGEGPKATATDIGRACQLVDRCLLLWLACIGVLFALLSH